MDLKEAIMTRRSVRGFQQTPVSQETLRDVLTLATRAVSANNLQPWEILVVTGDTLDQLRRMNVEDLYSNAPADHMSAKPDEPYNHRAKTIGKALFTAMGIARDDMEKRAWWGERGLRFFDAPAVILLCMDKALGTENFRFDLGCLTQNICLSAMEYGLGTCVEDQAIRYQRGIRELLGVPESKIMVTGIAIGYPDETFAANQVKSQREPLDEVSAWYGF